MKPNKDDIQRNLEHVRKGEALDIPLAVLDGELKRRWWIETHRKEINEKQKAYHQRPEVKAHMKAYKKAYYLNVTTGGRR